MWLRTTGKQDLLAFPYFNNNMIRSVKLSMAGPIGRTKDFRALLEKSTKTVKALLGI